MWGRLFETLHARFKNGQKSVRRKKMQFLPFFLSLFLILSLFFTITVAFDSHYLTEADTIRTEYDYHLAIKGLDQSQALTLQSDLRTVFANDFVYRVVAVTEHALEGEDSTFDVYILFLTGNKMHGIFGLFIPDTPQSNYTRFSLRYRDVYAPEEGNAGTLMFSPLYDLDSLYWQNAGIYLLVMAGAFLISVWLLGALFRIRLSQDCFVYGIYATFGADARRLRSAAFWEMLVCVLTVTPAAVLFSAVAGYWIYPAAGVPFHFRPPALMFPLLLCIPLLFCAVHLPMKQLAQREPLSLIAAADNSDLVAHPRRSARLVGRVFPRFYEWLTGLRYRRHYLRLMGISALLSAIFVCGLYLGDLYRITADVRKAHDAAFSVRFSAGVPDDVYENFSTLDGIQSLRTDYPTYSLESNALFVSVPRQYVLPLSGLSAHPLDDTRAVFHDATAIGIPDEHTLRYFADTYGVIGDLSSVLHDEKTVAVGRTLANRETFSYAVGDCLDIAVPVALISEIPDASMLSGPGLLQEQILHIAYEYRSFRIGAILENYPSAANGLPILMNNTAYKSLTGQTCRATQLYITVEPTLSAVRYRTLEDSIRGLAHAYPGASAEANNTYFSRRMEDALCIPPLVLLSSSVFLLFLPLIWFFAQLFFTGKRAGEFHILRALGAPTAHIRRLHLQNALLLIPLTLPALLPALLCMALLWWLVNDLFPLLLRIPPTVVLPLQFSGVPYLIVFSLTCLCSALSAIIPYLRYRHAQTKDPFEYFGKDGEL